MRLRWVPGAAALAAALAGPVHAQSPERPNLILTVAGGISTAGPLWVVDKQPALVPGSPAPQYDTLAIERLLRPGVTALVGAALFRSPHLGYTLEAAFFGLASEGRCAPQDTFITDSERINEQACSDVQGKHVPTSAVGFQAGLVYRFAAQRVAEPYLRASAGIAVLGSSYVQTFGIVRSSRCARSTTCPRFFLDEPERREITWVASLAAGASLEMGAGYRFRAEVRDLVIALPVAAGAAEVTGSQAAIMGTRVRHIPVLTAGMDIVLERRHRRRY